MSDKELLAGFEMDVGLDEKKDDIEYDFSATFWLQKIKPKTTRRGPNNMLIKLTFKNKPTCLRNYSIIFTYLHVVAFLYWLRMMI